MNGFRFASVLLAGSLLLSACGAGSDTVIVGATTSVEDTGLLDELVAAFEDESGVDVTPIVAGSGQILELGRRGEVDMTLTHSADDEAAYVADGYGTDSAPVMYNQFIVIGPEDDPAGAGGSATAAEAFESIAAAGETFVSRGDGSGTNRRELSIWAEIGIEPAGEDWYQESAVSQGQSLLFASDRQAYTFVDSATFVVFLEDIDLVQLAMDMQPNTYTAILVNPDLHGEVNADGARDFFEFLTSDRGKDVISFFAVESYDGQLFTPFD